MARPETILDPTDGPVAEFAHGLRELRRQAGGPSYRTLAQRAHYSSTTLSEATRGVRLPSLEVTRAYVRACGADEQGWELRWQDTEARLRVAVPEPLPDPAVRRSSIASIGAGWWVALGAMLIMLVTVATAATTALLVTLAAAY